MSVQEQNDDHGLHQTSPDAPPNTEIIERLIAHLDTLVWVTTPDKRVVYVSPAFERIWGRERRALLESAHAFLEWIHPDDRERVRSSIPEQLLGTWHSVYRIVRPDGEVRWLRVRTVPLPDAQGRVDFVGGLTEDITEQRAAEAARNESEYRYRVLTESSGVGIWHIDVAGYTVYLNPAMCRMLEVDSAEELRGRTFHAFFSPESLERMQLEHAKRPAGIRSAYEVEIIGRRSGRRNALIHGAPLAGANGNLEGLIGTFTDITDLRLHQRMLDRENRARQLLTKVIQQLSNARDLETVVRVVRSSARELVGSDGITFILRNGDMAYYVDEDAVGPLWKGQHFPLEQCVSGYVMTTASPIVSPDIFRDERVPHEPYRGTFVKSLAMVPIRSEDPIGAIGAYWADCHEAEATEVNLLQALADSASVAMANVQLYEDLEASLRNLEVRAIELDESKRRYEAAVEAAHHMLYEWDPETGRVLWGGNADQAPGTSMDEWVERVHQDDRDAFRHAMHGALDGAHKMDLEYRLRQREDRYIRVHQSGRFFAASGSVMHMIGFVTDVTRRRELEEQLRQAQKMEAIGQLAAGVAHDFNNLLIPILGYAEITTAMVEPDSPIRDYMKDVLSAADRAKRLTTELLAFGRKQILEVKTLPLNDTVSGLRGILRRLIREDIELVTELNPATGNVSADETQLHQILMNLVVNAQAAMPDGGKLAISTDRVVLEAENQFHVPPGVYARLTVSDTGVGMDEETQRHIFEPFFTTKEAGHGTGLGLATVFGIVRQHGGGIFCRSKRDHGTSFEIVLPHAASAVREQSGSVKPLAPGTQHEVVLVVDDDAMVRGLTERILSRLGYTVLMASDPAQALDIARSNTSDIQLLLTDVVMPKMSGPALYRELLQLRPQIRVLYMSGYGGELIAKHGIPDEQTRLVKKPFRVADLARAVRQALSD